ncbi:putative alpha-mannosidase [Shigella flexneri 2002017]|nr:putative alpha-mannosidase [Shigella flexneri 2002017]
MSGSAFAVTHHAFSSGAGRTSDGNGSHASTLKSPSYTKLVSWQHYLNLHGFVGRIRRVSVASDINKAHFTNYRQWISPLYFRRLPASSTTFSPSSLENAPFCASGRISSTTSEGRHRRVPSGVTTIGRLIRIGC